LFAPARKTEGGLRATLASIPTPLPLKDIAMSVVRLTLLNGDSLDLYDKPSAVYPLAEGERCAGGKSIVLVDGKEFRVLESIDSIKRRFETPTTANAAEVESPSSRHALPRTT
jgi:hypothetical protein